MNNNKLAKLVIEVLDKKAHKGCKNKFWSDFQNGLGEDIGVEIENLISEAKKIISTTKQ